MNSSIRAKTVLREALPGQLRLPLYCGQRNSTKSTSTPRVSHRDSARLYEFHKGKNGKPMDSAPSALPMISIDDSTVQNTSPVYLAHACIVPLYTVSVRPDFAFIMVSR